MCAEPTAVVRPLKGTVRYGLPAVTSAVSSPPRPFFAAAPGIRVERGICMSGNKGLQRQRASLYVTTFYEP